MSVANITSATYWAAISPPSRGRRWINYGTLRTTKRESIRAFVGGEFISYDRDRTHWSRFSGEGWTIERVFLTPVLKASAE